MNMDWWEELDYDRRSDFLTYLRKVSKQRAVSLMHPQLLEEQQRIRDLIIPTLDPENGDGWIPEDLDRVRELGQRWHMTNHDLRAEIRRLYDRMIQPLSSSSAGRILGLSANTMSRKARQGKIVATKNGRYWQFTREILIDHLL